MKTTNGWYIVKDEKLNLWFLDNPNDTNNHEIQNGFKTKKEAETFAKQPYNRCN